jgi:hypothetical protein
MGETYCLRFRAPVIAAALAEACISKELAKVLIVMRYKPSYSLPQGLEPGMHWHDITSIALGAIDRARINRLSLCLLVPLSLCASFACRDARILQFSGTFVTPETTLLFCAVAGAQAPAQDPLQGCVSARARLAATATSDAKDRTYDYPHDHPPGTIKRIKGATAAHTR